MSFIERLDLTPEEKQIYQLLLGCGQLTSYETAQFSKLHQSKVDIALDALVNKGAVGVSEGYIKKYYVRIPLEYLAEDSEKLSLDIKANLDETTIFIQNKKDLFNQTRESITSQLESEVEQKKTDIDNSLSFLQSSLNSTSQQKKQVIAEKSVQLTSDLKTIEDEKKAILNDKIQGYFDENVNNLNHARSSLNTVIGSIKQQTDVNVADSNNQIEQLTQGSITSIQSVSETLKPKLEELHQKYLNEINELMQLLNQNVDVSKLDVRSFNKTQSEKYLTYSSEITRSAEKNIDSVSESVSANLQGLGESLDLLLNRKVEELSLSVQEAVNSLNEKMANIRETLVNALIQQKNSAISSTVSQVKESMALKYTDLHNKEQSQRNNMISERDMFMQKMESHFNETVQTFNEKLNETKIGAAEKFTTFNEEFYSRFNEISNSIVLELNKNIQSFRTLSDHLNASFSDSYITGTNQLKEKWSDLIEKAQTIMRESESTLTNHFVEVSNLLQSSTNSFMDDFNQFIQESLDSALNVVNQMATKSKLNIDDGKQLLESGIKAEVDESAKYIEESNRKMSDTANYLLGMTMKLKNDFRTLEATSKQTTIPPVQTTSIIGLEAIKDNISRIVKETKRGVTILSPTKDYIPVEAIKMLPPTTKVTLVTKLDEITDNDWISSVLDAQANVELRKFRDTGTGVELPRFIGIERENEEVLIAAQDEVTGEVVGILSKSTYFAKLVSYIVIADFARGRSTQIK